MEPDARLRAATQGVRGGEGGKAPGPSWLTRQCQPSTLRTLCSCWRPALSMRSGSSPPRSARSGIVGHLDLLRSRPKNWRTSSRNSEARGCGAASEVRTHWRRAPASSWRSLPVRRCQPLVSILPRPNLAKFEICQSWCSLNFGFRPLWRPSLKKLRTCQFDPKRALRIGPINGREARESGRRRKALVQS
jgi:hypothetical protein